MKPYRVLIAACVLLWQTSAMAQSNVSAEQREAASVHFMHGVELFQDGAYRAALVEFQRAYEIAPHFKLLFNMGQTQYELQDFLGAVKSYEQYLAEGGSQIPAKQRDDLESTLDSLRKRVARISVTVNRDGSDIFIDDAKIGQSPIQTTIPVNAGQHRVVARAPWGATDSKVVDVAGGEVGEVSLQLADKPPVEIVEVPGDSGRPLGYKLAFIGWGTGAALLIGSIVTGTMALSADGDLDDMLKGVNVDPKKESDQRDKVKTLVMTTDILFASGAAFAVAGTVMWLVGRKERRGQENNDISPEKTAKLHWDVGLGSLSMRRQF